MDHVGAVERPTMEYSFPAADGTISSIALPTVQANNFEIKPSIICSSVQFSGLPEEDPNKHLSYFLEICDTFKFNGVSDDVVRLRIFPFSLYDSAKDWLQSLLLLDRESLYDAWDRFKVMLRRCPHHELPMWRQQGPPGYQQPQQQAPQEKKSNLEDMLSNFITAANTQFQNQDASIRNLEVQIGYAKFLKEVISNKRKWEGGASVNLMPYSIFENLGMHELTHTIITLQLSDRSIKYPRGIVEDVLVKVGNFIIPVDFIVLDMEEDVNMPLILGRPFIATSRALIDMQKGQLTFRVNDEHVVFNVFKPLKNLHKNEHDIFAINSINTPRTDSANLAKCKALKENCILSSNENNLQDMKKEHKEATTFVDTGHEPNKKKR
ncbi:UNVERIFIED_CONTAM: hypothetical protein Slati_3695300 [Sesamum latifolium]|uniref:Retrotransposon gag protein n=1 Tax=Sesamum latifolium TaxID=2727402 RepID=A0AAW2U610_9LAMI